MRTLLSLCARAHAETLTARSLTHSLISLLLSLRFSLPPTLTHSVGERVAFAALRTRHDIQLGVLEREF